MNDYNQNFLETPDPVTGLQRRTGQNFLDHKQTLHERLTLEHNFNVSEGSPQIHHGIHKEGSARAYVTAPGDADPADRPTGEDKAGLEIPPIALDTHDRGRLLIKNENEFWYWDGTAWVKIDTTPIGFIQIWPSPVVPPPQWLKCDGTDFYTKDDYPVLFSLLGSLYGGDGVTTFAVPNLQGISVVGAGQQTGFGSGNRTKGSGASVGTEIEDQIQTFDGNARATLSYGDGNIFHDVDGIFSRVTDLGGTDYKQLDRTGGKKGTQGIEINLDNELISGEYLRNGSETRVSALAMDYYIKAL